MWPAVASNARACAGAAFSSRRYELLRGLFDDRVHQPYRETLLPALFRVIAAGERAGAIGGFLSGSGSSIICLAVDRAEAIGRAMGRALPGAAVKILTADNTGLRVLS